VIIDEVNRFILSDCQNLCTPYTISILIFRNSNQPKTV